MNARVVFPERERDDPSLQRGDEGMYDFLSRSSSPEAEKAREIVEALYSVFPDPNGALLGVLSSGSGHEADDHFYGALGSLWLYSHLHKPEVLITTDEETPGSDKRPDLRLSSHTGEELLAVEITAIADDAETSTADWNFETLVGRINAGVSREGVYLSVIRKGAWTQTPPVGKMVATIEREVDAVLCNEGAIDPNVRELGKLRLQEGDCSVEITILRAGPGVILRRIVAVRGAEARLSTAVKRIRKKVKSKAPFKKDIAEGTAYAIALCDPDSLIDKVDLEDALYGTPVVDIAVPSGEVIGDRRRRDGFFGPGQGKPKNQRAAGVLAVQKLALVLHGEKPVLTLFENPYVAIGDLPELLRPDERFGVVSEDGEMLTMGYFT